MLRVPRASGSRRPHVKAIYRWLSSRHSQRCLVTLAIETSCDDTSVALAELPSGNLNHLRVHFHETVTASTASLKAYGGIHPLVALQSHRQSLAGLVEKALRCSPSPDFVAATRGPGMRSNLAVGLDTAKGLALGLQVPLLGVHHMQAHALTSRLVSAMQISVTTTGTCQPDFPFLTVLASGGHTTLINSTGLVQHTVLAETQDIAIGDCLDKGARAILPPCALSMPFGKALEDFAFPNGRDDYDYSPPARRKEELEERRTKWNWSLNVPFSNSKGGDKTSRRMAYSFAGLLTAAQRFMSHEVDGAGRLLKQNRITEEVTIDERRTMAQELQRVAFEHLASRIILHLSTQPKPNVKTIVVSGGVASNMYLRHVLRAMLDIRGFAYIDLAFPPVPLCTDNALMIAWAGFEMWHAGYRSTLDIEPIRKWSMDPEADDGGILGVGGWVNVG